MRIFSHCHYFARENPRNNSNPSKTEKTKRGRIQAKPLG
jgi:hypothetical protein